MMKDYRDWSIDTLNITLVNQYFTGFVAKSFHLRLFEIFALLKPFNLLIQIRNRHHFVTVVNSHLGKFSLGSKTNSLMWSVFVFYFYFFLCVLHHSHSFNIVVEAVACKVDLKIRLLYQKKRCVMKNFTNTSSFVKSCRVTCSEYMCDI